MTKDKLKLIGVSKETKVELDTRGNRNDTYESIIKKLLGNKLENN